MEEKLIGMEARSMDYILGVEDALLFVQNWIDSKKDREDLVKALDGIFEFINNERVSRFMGENRIEL